MIGHCLRFWPVYVEAKKIIDGGEFGKVLSARFHRTSATPMWSYESWLETGAQSGGAVLDMHIHDVDAALWWFGEPSTLAADGVIENDLPLSVEATWRYQNGPLVELHCAWDNNGGDFDYGFKVVMERATLFHQPAVGATDLKIIRRNAQGDASEVLPMPADSAYQLEVDAFIECLQSGQKMERITPEASRLAVRYCRDELKLMGWNG